METSWATARQAFAKKMIHQAATNFFGAQLLLGNQALSSFKITLKYLVRFLLQEPSAIV